jgi:hypothetical protein
MRKSITRTHSCAGCGARDGGAVDSTADVVIPGLATVTGWIPSVACDNGASQATFWKASPPRSCTDTIIVARLQETACPAA